MKKYEFLDGFLLSFSPELVDYEKFKEVQIVQEILTKAGREFVQLTLQEGQEVLAMEPFPWEWVCDTRGFYSCVPETGILIEDPKFYHDWLLNTLIILQEEAIKAGKLDKPVLKLK